MFEEALAYTGPGLRVCFMREGNSFLFVHSKTNSSDNCKQGFGFNVFRCHKLLINCDKGLNLSLFLLSL